MDFVHHVLVTNGGDGFGILLINLLAPCRFNFRVLRTDGQQVYLVEADINMVRGVKPTAEEPVQIDTAGILQSAEQVLGCWAFKLPAIGVFTERKIKQLATDNGFTQNVQRRCRFTVGVVAKL